MPINENAQPPGRLLGEKLGKPWRRPGRLQQVGRPSSVYNNGSW